METPLTVWVNEQRWVTLLCSPVARRQLALGFAYFAGLFHDLDEVLLVEECVDDPTQIKLRLSRTDVALQAPGVVTSGCGQGVAFERLPVGEHVPLASAIEPAQLWELMRGLQQSSELHRAVGGTHASALSDGKRLLAIYEDIGRHNTIDKLMGHSLLVGLDTAGLVLLTSGRVSSEMVYKAAQMRVSLVASRTTPTDLAVELARRVGMAVVGYVRGRQLTVYCGEVAGQQEVPG